MTVRGAGLSLRAVALLALAGCSAGSVKVDGPEAFGKARSGVWFDFESASGAWHAFALLDSKNACAEAQEMFPATAAAEAALVLKLEPLMSDPASQCTVFEAHYAEMADLTDPLFADGLHVLSLTLRDPEDDSADPPPEGSYRRFDVDAGDSKPYFLGALTYYEENPYRIFADVFDCSGSFQDDLDSREASAIQEWIVADGDAEATLGKDASYKIAVDGDLEDLEGKNDGSLTADGKFEHCEVSYEGDTSVTF